MNFQEIARQLADDMGPDESPLDVAREYFGDAADVLQAALLTELCRREEVEGGMTEICDKDYVRDGDYTSLDAVLGAAYQQAATGKGHERHARGNPFEKQHMQTISQLLDTDRGMAFQAIKKLTEGLDMADPDARERELLGAINYIAGIIIHNNMDK